MASGDRGRAPERRRGSAAGRPPARPGACGARRGGAPRSRAAREGRLRPARQGRLTPRARGGRARRRGVAAGRPARPRAARGAVRAGATARARRGGRADLRRARPRRDRGCDHRHREGSAGRGRRGAVGGALDARRLRPPLRAGVPAQRLAQPGAPDEGRIPRPREGGRAPCRAHERGARRAAPCAVPRRGLVRAAARAREGPGRGRSRGAPGAGSPAREAPGGDPGRRERRGGGLAAAVVERDADHGHGRRVLGAARLPAGGGNAPGRRRRVRPHGRRGAQGRDRAADHVGLPLRRRSRRSFSSKIPTPLGSRRPASRFTAARPSSTSGPRAHTGGWRATPAGSGF